MKRPAATIAQLLSAAGRRRHIVAFTLAAGCLAGAAYYLAVPRSYVAKSQVLITPTKIFSTNSAAAQASRPQSLATYQTLLHSALVFDLARNRIQELPPEGRVDFSDQRRDAWGSVLAHNLTSSVSSDNSILEIQFRSSSPAAAPLVVGALTGALADCLKRQQKEASTEMLATLQHERLGVEQRLLDKRQQFAAKVAAARTATSEIEQRLLEIDLQRLSVKHEALASHILDVEVQQNHPPVRLEIISPAVEPQRPAWPKWTWVMLTAAGCGFAIGISACLWLEMTDDRIRQPDELRQCVGAPLLATLGRLPNSDGHGLSTLLAHSTPQAGENEPLRLLRDTLIHGPQPNRVIAITSVEPGDGKTTVLANLGVVFAQAARRTLLIDADLRRRGLTQLFQRRTVAGLSSVLSATTGISAAADDIQSLGIENLDLLAAGPRPLLPGELLGSARMTELLQWARSQYDQVLIDLPPLAGQIDAAIVGRLAEGVVLVVQPEINRRARVDRTVQQLSDFGVRIAGVVANRASPYGAFGQGDGYSYRYAETAIGNVANDPAHEEWAIEDAAPTAPPSSSLDDIRPRRVA